jgi:hypothetical protein
MTVGMEEDTRKLYYLTVGEQFTVNNSKKYVEMKEMSHCRKEHFQKIFSSI